MDVHQAPSTGTDTFNLYGSVTAAPVGGVHANDVVGNDGEVR